MASNDLVNFGHFNQIIRCHILNLDILMCGSWTVFAERVTRCHFSNLRKSTRNAHWTACAGGRGWATTFPRGGSEGMGKVLHSAASSAAYRKAICRGCFYPSISRKEQSSRNTFECRVRLLANIARIRYFSAEMFTKNCFGIAVTEISM